MRWSKPVCRPTARIWPLPGRPRWPVQWPRQAAKMRRSPRSSRQPSGAPAKDCKRGVWTWGTPLEGRIELAERLVHKAARPASRVCRPIYRFVVRICWWRKALQQLLACSYWRRATPCRQWYWVPTLVVIPILLLPLPVQLVERGEGWKRSMQHAGSGRAGQRLDFKNEADRLVNIVESKQA